MKLRVEMLVDFMASACGSTDDEYAEIEGHLTEIYPDVELVFERQVFMHQLEARDDWDVFVFDWGGLLPGAEDMTRSLYRHLLGLIRKYETDRLFIMWSAFTERYFKEVANEDFPEFIAPNVVYRQDDQVTKRCRLFFGLDERPAVKQPYNKHGPPGKLVTPRSRPSLGPRDEETVFCQIDEGLIDIIRAEAAGRTIIDCGAGAGLLHDMMPRHSLVSLDIIPKANITVLQRDARTFPYSAQTLPVFLRPCHSGFVEDTLTNAAKAGAKSALYVSHPRNQKADLGCFADNIVRVSDWVGQDGEHVFRVDLA